MPGKTKTFKDVLLRSLLVCLWCSPLFVIAGIVLAMKIHFNTVVYDYEINREVSLTVLEPKREVTSDDMMHVTLNFMNSENGEIISGKQDLIGSNIKTACYDFYKDRVGQTVIFKEEKGIATSFFGTYDFDRTANGIGITFLACEHAWVKGLENKSK